MRNGNILSAVAFIICMNACNVYAVTSRTYDKDGLLVQDGDYTWTYDYYSDGTMKSKTKLDSSGNAVLKDVYEYDVDNKTITRSTYSNASAISSNSKSSQDVFKYDTSELFSSAQSNVSRLGLWFAPEEGIGAPLGATERQRTVYSGNTFAAGTVFNVYDSQGRLKETYLCGSNTTCITNARNGVYTNYSRSWVWDYETDASGKVTVRENYWGTPNNQVYTYEYDEHGNVVKMWNRNTLTYTATWENPSWREVPEEYVAKRIYTIEEAVEATSGKWKNTFSIRYR